MLQIYQRVRNLLLLLISLDSAAGVAFFGAFLEGLSFVVEFFTTAEGDDEFDVVTGSQKFGRDDAHRKYHGRDRSI